MSTSSNNGGRGGGGAAAASTKQSTSGGATRSHELALVKRKGCKFVVGADEAGRGPLAGPVVAAACHVPLGVTIEGVGDSKVRAPMSAEGLLVHNFIHHRNAVAVK